MSNDVFPVSRRRFLVSTAATVGIAVAPGLPLRVLARTSATDPGSSDLASNHKVLHIIGHSHIDAAWLWPWRDGENEVLNTFRSALNRMAETPDFRYSHSSVAHYRWVERADPSMYAEIKKRISEGRW